MKPGMKIADHIATVRRIAPLLLGPCMLLAVAGSAQTNVDPLHQMSPAQQQHAMFGPGQSLPVAQNHAAKPATPVKPANDGNQAGCGQTMKVRKTRSPRSERRKCHQTGSFVGAIRPSGKVPESA